MVSRFDTNNLIVDQHRGMVELLMDMLTDAGYLVEFALSGAEALAKARVRPPDVVITELRMEGLDGFDVLEGIKEINAKIPVLVMTSFGASESEVEAIKKRAHRHLTKPFCLSEMSLTLSELT